MPDIVIPESNPAALPATIDQIEQALAVAQSPEQVNGLLAIAESAAAFAARYYKPQEELVTRAREVMLRVKRRLGELLKARPADPSRNLKRGRKSPEVEKSTSGNSGVDKETSRQARKLAEIPPESFEEVVAGRQTVKAAVAETLPEKPKPAVAEHKQTRVQKLEGRIAEMEGEIRSLREQADDLAAQAAETLADNESMAKVFEADDRITAALAEAKKYREMNRLLEERIRGMQSELNAAIRTAKGYKARLERLEKAA
jgi:hypothetical protein